MAELTVAQHYALMIPRIRHMDTEEIEDLLRDLEDDDPNGDYSAATQEAAQAELEHRWVLANPSVVVGPTTPITVSAPQHAVVAALSSQ